MKHVEVSDGSPMGHVGLRKVSDNNNIFVNSKKKDSNRTIEDFGGLWRIKRNKIKSM